MIFRETNIDGIFAIALERYEDDRGFFARTFCVEEFALQGLNTSWVQCNLSHSNRKGTIRGIHYQAHPEPDAKLVRVTRGSIFAVAVDLRPDRRSFGDYFSDVLSQTDGMMLYVPAGCGLGYQTLADGAELFYQMSVCYRPELARGIRWNDPALGIHWPLPPACISDRDARLPGLRDIEHALA
jgi:dTDP-4-dehydrorhamnose 3,5-epimerase